MKIQKELVLETFERLSKATPNKFWGFLAICHSISHGQEISNGITYPVSTKKISSKLEELFNFGATKEFHDSSVFVRFSKFWVDQAKEQLLKKRPNILDVAIFYFRNHSFSNAPSASKLVANFLEEIKISSTDSSSIFEMNFSEQIIPLEEYTNEQFFVDLKSKMDINSSNSTLGFEAPFTMSSHPGELSRAPFIQTLYSGTRIQELLLYLKFDIDEYYLTKSTVPNSENSSPKNIIFYGAPGTGKSYKVNKLLQGEEDRTERVTFHPEYDYASFIGGYKPTMGLDENGKEVIKYHFVPQIFTNLYIEAWKNPEKEYYLVIEEINRGNCAEIFGDMFQLLDRNSGYSISPSEELRGYLKKQLESNRSAGIANEKMNLPNNLTIWATMNTSDQSLFPMDSAFKRRWEWKYVPICYAELTEDGERNSSFNYVININELLSFKWIDFIKSINSIIKENPNLGMDKCIGNYFISTNNNQISLEEFINKVIFYLWNDVFKDEENNVFEDNSSYEDFFPISSYGKQKVLRMLEKIGVNVLSNNVAQTENRDENSN